tara:strand:+ start:6076 stop:6270 length:195 start_codon:yes stop_codon:yes gene_type:complete
MSGKQSKQLRKIVGYDKENSNPIIKRLYKRIKKAYSNASEKEKPFVKIAALTLSNKNTNVRQQR